MCLRLRIGFGLGFATAILRLWNETLRNSAKCGSAALVAYFEFAKPFLKSPVPVCSYAVCAIPGLFTVV